MLGRRKRSPQPHDGWAEPQSWPARGSDGSELVFRMRLPNALELVDPSAVATAAPGAPELVNKGARALTEAAAGSAVILIGCLRPTTVQPAERSVLATMTVVLAPLEGPPRAQDWLPPAGSERVDIEVTKLSDRAILIDRASAESTGSETEPVIVQQLQYVIETGRGALALVFATTDPQMMGPPARAIYRGIVDSVELGPRAESAA